MDVNIVVNEGPETMQDSFCKSGLEDTSGKLRFMRGGGSCKCLQVPGMTYTQTVVQFTLTSWIATGALFITI